ncbi:hypothetical protein QRD43_22195 [Pelomonas sp. APW6]|uniref:DUF2244 domain-containing protein n=1 Tax=Roseateles subflavus TaxID=3053353 RepID=A0ABT7LP29_9BURK|nr:hypothetical protein [Pelomonas sp. APW6]MDL5034633.1 hypothetical protein [Pelomonas sp. APW6]
MRSSAALFRRLRDEIPQARQVLLPRVEVHPLSWGLGLTGTALGLWGVPALPAAMRPGAGWLALGLVVAGMAVWGFMRREHLGWRLDFAARQLDPVGVDGESRRLDGSGWGLFCVGGAKRRSLALEFRHEDGGKALRVLETRAGASREEHQLVSQIADALAERLQMRREGLTL